MRTQNAPADGTHAARTRPRFGRHLSAALAALALLAGCVPPSNWQNGPERAGRVSGRVVTLDGAPVSGALVTVAGRQARSDADGRFALDGVAPAERLAVEVAGDRFVRTVAVYRVEAGRESYRTLPLIARAPAVRLDAARGGEVPLGRDGRVTIPAGALVDESGRPAEGEVQVRATYIDPADPRQVAAAPGDYRAGPQPDSLAQMETFGMLELTFTSAAGRTLRLAEGQAARVAWPRPPRGGEVRGNLFALSPATGLWEVRQTIDRVALVRDSTVWNWDYLYASTCIHVNIGAQVAGISVSAQGVDYSGVSTALTDAQGDAFVGVRPNSVVDVSFTAPGTATSTVRVSTPAAGVVLPPCTSRIRGGTAVTSLAFNPSLLAERRVDAITPLARGR